MKQTDQKHEDGDNNAKKIAESLISGGKRNITMKDHKEHFPHNITCEIFLKQKLVKLHCTKNEVLY